MTKKNPKTRKTGKHDPRAEGFSLFVIEKTKRLTHVSHEPKAFVTAKTSNEAPKTAESNTSVFAYTTQ